jgi:predicted nucleic acid-binding protein
MCRLLLDTNILLDAILSNREHSSEAQALIDSCCGWGDLGMTCCLSLKDTYYIATRVHGKTWAREAVGRLMDLLPVAPVDAETCARALGSDEPDFEDGIIRACAELNDVDFIVTRDKDAFAHSKVRSVTAAQYLEIACAKDEDRTTPWPSHP